MSSFNLRPTSPSQIPIGQQPHQRVQTGPLQTPTPPPQPVINRSEQQYAQQFSARSNAPQTKDIEKANTIIERQLNQPGASAQCKGRLEQFSDLLSQKWDRFFGSSPPLTQDQSSQIRALMNQYSVGFSDHNQDYTPTDSVENESAFVEVNFTDLHQFDQSLSDALKTVANANELLELSPESIQQTQSILKVLESKAQSNFKTLPTLAITDQTAARKDNLSDLQNNLVILSADLNNHQSFNDIDSQGHLAIDQGRRILETPGNQTLGLEHVSKIESCLTVAQQKLTENTQAKLNKQGSQLQPAKIADLKARIDQLQSDLDLRRAKPTTSTLKQEMETHNEVRAQQQKVDLETAESEKAEQIETANQWQQSALKLAVDTLPETPQITAISSNAQEISGQTLDLSAKAVKHVTDLADEVVAEVSPVKDQILKGLSLLSESSQDAQAQGSLLIKQGLEQLQTIQTKTGIIVYTEGQSLVLSSGNKTAGNYQELTLSQKDSQWVVKQGDFLIQQKSTAELTITRGDETGDHQQFKVTPEKITLTVVQGNSETQGEVSGNKRAGKASATTTLSNIGGTDWGMKAGASISWERKDERLDDGRTKHVRSICGQGTVGATGAHITASIGGGISTNTIYLRSPRVGENAQGKVRAIDPPSLDVTQKNPSKTLALTGDTVIYSRNFNLNASVGYQDPTGFHVEVSASYAKEMRIGIQRLDGDPPLFRMRIEPETTQATVDLSGGWGPFSVGIGAGKAAAVFYEFDLSEAKVSEILDTRTLPVMPNPKDYLGEKGTPITQEAFMAFNAISGDGVKLVEFGASKSIEGHGSVNAKVATARISLESYQNLSIQENHASLESGRTLTISNSAWFRGDQSRQSDRLHVTSTHFTKDNQIEQRYDGLRAAYKISDTQTSHSDLKERLTATNLLLGRSPEHSLQLPSRGTDFAQTEISVAVEIKPEHISQLAALQIEGEPDNDALNIRAVAYCTGVDPSKLLKLIENIQVKNIEIKQSKSLSPGMLVKTHMSKEQMLCKLQGEVLGEFIDSHTLQSIAALDRLLGGQIASSNNSSNVYDQQLTAIGANIFKPSLEKDKTWDDFGQIATRQQQLAGLKKDLEGSGSILTNEVKTSLLQKIESQSQDIQEHLNTLLSDPTRRNTVVSALVNGSSNSRVMTSIRNTIADNIGVVDHHLHIASNKELVGYIEQVFSATIKAHTHSSGVISSQMAYRQELAGHINQILKIDDPKIASMTLGLFKAADKEGGLAEILAGIKDKRMPQLVANLSDQQKQELALLVATAHDSKRQRVNKALSQDQLIVKASVAVLDQELTDLTKKMALEFKAGAETDPGKLMELYKPAMRNQREFHQFMQKVSSDPKFPQAEKARLLSACELNIAILDSRLDQSQLSKLQQVSLLKGLMNPDFLDYVGNSSRALLDGLIEQGKTDSDQLIDYIQPLLKDTDRTGKQLKQILTTLGQDHPDKLATALVKIPIDSLTQMVEPSLSARLTSQLAESRESLIEKISEQLSSQLSFEAGTISDQALQGVITKVDGLDLAALKTEIQAQYTELMPESIRQGAEQEREQWITEHAQEHIGQVIDKALKRLKSDRVMTPDEMLQLVLKAQAEPTSTPVNKLELGKQAEALRQLNGTYEKLSKAFVKLQTLSTGTKNSTSYISLQSEIARLKSKQEKTKETKRTDPEIMSLAQKNMMRYASGSGPNLAYFKAMAHISTKFEALQGRLAGAKLQQALNQNHSQPLDVSLHSMQAQLTTLHANLALLSPDERKVMLAALVESPGFMNFQTNDGSQNLVKELIKLAEKDGHLIDLKEILFEDPQNHAGSLLAILTKLDQSSQTELFKTLHDDKIKALAKGLSSQGKTELIGLLREAAANDTLLAPKLEALLNQNKDYETALAKMKITTVEFKNLPTQPGFSSPDIKLVSPDLVERLKADFKLLARLETIQTKLNGLEEAYREPHLTEITAQIDLLKAKTSLKCSGHTKNQEREKQTALVNTLIKGNLGTRSNLVLNHLIDSLDNPDDLAKITQAIFKANPDKVEVLNQPIFRILGAVSKAHRNEMLQSLFATKTSIMSTSSLEILAEKAEETTQFHQLQQWVKDLDDSAPSALMKSILERVSKNRGRSF